MIMFQLRVAIVYASWTFAVKRYNSTLVVCFSSVNIFFTFKQKKNYIDADF